MASTEDAFARYEQRVKEATASLAAEVAALRQAAEAGVATPAAGTGSSAAGTAAVSRDAASSREDKRQLLHEKVFVARESLLTHMLNGDESFRAIYNAMIAVLLWLGVKLVLQNWETQGRLLDVDSLAWAFGKVRTRVGPLVVSSAFARALSPSLLLLPLSRLRLRLRPAADGHRALHVGANDGRLVPGHPARPVPARAPQQLDGVQAGGDRVHRAASVPVRVRDVPRPDAPPAASVRPHRHVRVRSSQHEDARVCAREGRPRPAAPLQGGAGCRWWQRGHLDASKPRSWHSGLCGGWRARHCGQRGCSCSSARKGWVAGIRAQGGDGLTHRRLHADANGVVGGVAGVLWDQWRADALSIGRIGW